MARPRHKRGRPVSGILLLDKPPGISSNAALQRAKRLFEAQKAGHTGNLDVMASGLLPVCFGEATKLSGFLLNARKRYVSTFQLGLETDTGDAEGRVTGRYPVPELSEDQVEAILDRYRGVIEQIPPMYSAIKRGGQPLYKLARQGVVVAREPRRVEIFRLTLLDLSRDRMQVDTSCSKGTYIRTLAQDIGRDLSCGAHVCELRRLEVGPFGGAAMLDFEELEGVRPQGLGALDARLLPMDSALSAEPRVVLSEDSVFYVRRGQPVLVPRAPTAGLLRLYDQGGSFMGVGEVLEDGRIAPRRLIRRW